MRIAIVPTHPTAAETTSRTSIPCLPDGKLLHSNATDCRSHGVGDIYYEGEEGTVQKHRSISWVVRRLKKPYLRLFAL